MVIKSLKLLNFRNYENIDLEFSDSINIFIGENGVGKTNILESIYVLSLTKSNRYGIDSNLIKYDSKQLSISGIVNYRDYFKNYKIVIDKFSKKVFINNNEIKRISEYVSNFCVVAFLPSDIEIIKGSPTSRRNLLNIQIGQLYNNYIFVLNEYNHLVKYRNDYLKSLCEKNSNDFIYLSILNNKLISLSLKIYYYRFMFIEKINSEITNIYEKISGISNLKVEYVNNLDIFSYDSDLIKEKLLSKFNKNKMKEIYQGITLYGPHRDDLVFKINNQDIRLFASEGQQKLVIIAYKIAELKIFKEIKKEYPVLLLDDVFSEIDIKKCNRIIKYLKGNIQTIITTNDINNINLNLVKNARIFKIKNGCITIKGGVKNGR